MDWKDGFIFQQKMLRVFWLKIKPPPNQIFIGKNERNFICKVLVVGDPGSGNLSASHPHSSLSCIPWLDHICHNAPLVSAVMHHGRGSLARELSPQKIMGVQDTPNQCSSTFWLHKADDQHRTNLQAGSCTWSESTGQMLHAGSIHISDPVQEWSKGVL